MYIEIGRNLCDILVQLQRRTFRVEMDKTCSIFIEQSVVARLDTDVRIILLYKLILNSILEDKLIDMA
jgi:hypothetical protein